MDSLAKMKEIEDAELEININYHEVEGTPFMIIEKTENDETVFFGALGKHRLTDFYATLSEALEDIKQINWDRIVTVMYITLEGQDLIKPVQ